MDILYDNIDEMITKFVPVAIRRVRANYTACWVIIAANMPINVVLTALEAMLICIRGLHDLAELATETSND